MASDSKAGIVGKVNLLNIHNSAYSFLIVVAADDLKVNMKNMMCDIEIKLLFQCQCLKFARPLLRE